MKVSCVPGTLIHNVHACTDMYPRPRSRMELGKPHAVLLFIDSILTLSVGDAAPETPTRTADADEPNNADGPTRVDLNTASVEPDGTVTDDDEEDEETTTRKEVFPANSPAGSVQMIEPITTTLVLFKIGDFISFRWNYTNLLADPTAVDVLAVDSAATVTHTLTENMTFEVPGQFTWDTDQYQEENAGNNGLRVAWYTLYIHDSDESPTEVADAGYLSPYNQLQFGLYTPQPYTPLSEWTCAVCNSVPVNPAASAAGLAVTLAFGAGVAVVLL